MAVHHKTVQFCCKGVTGTTVAFRGALMPADLDAGALSIKPGDPWVLLDDARSDGGGVLYREPATILTAHTGEELVELLTVLDRTAAAGRVAAGWLAYEAGTALEPSLSQPPSGAAPLGWFGVFNREEPVEDVVRLLPDPAGAAVVSVESALDREAYHIAFAQVAEAIRAGIVYQANLTFPSVVTIAGDPLAAYARLRHEAAAPFSAIVWTGERLILSFSPELFVRREGGTLSARPMKGTAARRDDPALDAASAADLAADPKQRAENRMIVDLIRNDLSRVSAPGSVEVTAMFAVESYPTVHQMTSTVRSSAIPDTPHSAVLRALFPCGSITGAPKIEAQRLLARVEAAERGAYCGAIGRIGPVGRMDLSVAIRTLEAERVGAPGQPVLARLGLGSGIVADSTADAEWEECRLKGAFVARAAPSFDLIETMRYDPDRGLQWLDGHLARLSASAVALGFAFDRHDVRNELQAATFGLTEAMRVRLLLARVGAVAIELSPEPVAPEEPWRVALVPMALPRADLRRWHKTTDRAFYDRPRRESGADEVVFVDDGQVTEGSFTSVFVERKDRLLTPPADRGIVPGVLRAELLTEGRAIEAPLTPSDLAQGFWLGNSLRGLVRARTSTVL